MTLSTAPASSHPLYRDAVATFRTSVVRYRLQGSPFYADLSALCAEDEALMSLAAEAARGQPHNHIFFGAIHFLVLSDPSDPLAAYFGAGDRAPVADAATFAALKDFCRRRRAEIMKLLTTRTVQFTMVSRANFVPPLLGHAMKQGAREPLSLIEVGSSAGLVTVFDHYFFDYGPWGRLGDPTAPHVAVARYEGKPPPVPDHMPQIVDRVGIDINPVDPSDPVERRWIEAMMAPDMLADRKMLSDALDRRARIPLPTITGDALIKVPEILPSRQGTICLLHSFCLYQWPAELQTKFHEMLCDESRQRTIYRLAIDVIHDNPVRPAGAVNAGDDLVMDMTTITYRSGKAEWEFLGRCDVWGRRVAWVA